MTKTAYVRHPRALPTSSIAVRMDELAGRIPLSAGYIFGGRYPDDRREPYEDEVAELERAYDGKFERWELLGRGQGAPPAILARESTPDGPVYRFYSEPEDPLAKAWTRLVAMDRIFAEAGVDELVSARNRRRRDRFCEIADRGLLALAAIALIAVVLWYVLGPGS